MAKLKISGAELKRYWDDESEWGEHREVTDITMQVNGSEVDRYTDVNSLADTDAVVIMEAYIYDHKLNREVNLITLINKWRQKQSAKTLLISVNSANCDELLAAIKQIPSAKVIG